MMGSTLFIDLETTGLSTSTDRIIELTALKVHPDGAKEERSVPINPGIPISPGAMKVHGITDDDVADKPSFKQYASSLMTFIDGADLGGFGAIRFDLPMLIAEFRRVGLELDLNGRSVVDPMVIYHKFEPRNLESAYEKYCGKPLEAAHSSLADVRAAAEVLSSQLEFYADLPEDMEGLHTLCHPREPDWIDDEGKLIHSEEGPLLGFGKYQGRRLKEVAEIDQGYLAWINNSDFSQQVKDIVGAFLAEEVQRSEDNGFDFRRDVIYDQKVEWTEQNTYDDEDE